MTYADSIIENAALRARLSRTIAPQNAAPIGVVITANEINDRHGTGLLLKRILHSDQVFSIRSRNDWGIHDFGIASATIPQRGVTRPESFRNVLRVLSGRTIGQALCVPYLPDEVATAIAIREMFSARLCAYIMDDQNVSASAIPDSILREFLEKSALRLVTHPELRAAYEKKYGLEFFLLPAVVPDRLIARTLQTPQFKKRGAIIGSIWDQAWFDDLSTSLEGSGWPIDWFGNHRFWSVDVSERKLQRSGIAAHGVVPESQLALELRNYPFVIVPVAAGHHPNRGELALSLPGRILFTMATSHTPILIVGSDESCAGRFVRHFGIGTVAPYSSKKIREAMEFLADPAQQTEMRHRAAAIGTAFTDHGVREWLHDSIQLGRPADGRFENAFAGYYG